MSAAAAADDEVECGLFKDRPRCVQCQAYEFKRTSFNRNHNCKHTTVCEGEEKTCSTHKSYLKTIEKDAEEDPLRLSFQNARPENG